jgi:hypothetical protein
VGGFAHEILKLRLTHKNEPVENYDYDDQPHEIAAREAEETLYKEYMLDIKR